jgi:hypothetical protein
MRYEQGIVPVRAAHALRFGTLIHRGLEAWWGADREHRLTAALAAVQSQPVVPDGDPTDSIKAEVMLTGYHLRWEDALLETVAVESEFVTGLLNPVTGCASRTWQLAGKIDAVARDSRGRVWMVEHKTGSGDIGPGSVYWDRLRIDAQVSTYFVGARSLGHDVAGCIYDVLRKPALRRLLATPEECRRYTKAGEMYKNQREQDETLAEYRARLMADVAARPEEYFTRGEVVRLEEEEMDAAYDVWQIGRVIRESQLTHRWPRNPDACERYGRMCDYWPICSRVASIDDLALFASAPPHAELDRRMVA